MSIDRAYPEVTEHPKLFRPLKLLATEIERDMGCDDGCRRDRLARGIVLENCELAIVGYALRQLDRGRSHIVDVGSGCGILCIVLSILGFRVTTFGGERLRCDALERMIARISEDYPDLYKKLVVREGLFPDAMTAADAAASDSNVLVSTDTIGIVEPSSQLTTLMVATFFDRLLIDVATFARQRDAIEQDALRALLRHGFTCDRHLWQDRLLDLRPKQINRFQPTDRPQQIPTWLMGPLPLAAATAGPFDLDVAEGTLSRHRHRWSLRLPEGFAPLSDDVSSPNKSPFRMLENGFLMGSPHATHADIEDVGGGRYSHWGDYLLFSTPDGSDPRSNGRRYQIFASVLEGVS